MSKDDAFVGWASSRIARAARRDADAPAFGAAYSDSASLSAAERKLVKSFPTRGVDAATLREGVDRLLDRHVANGRSPRFENQLFSGVEDGAMAGEW